MTPARFPYPFGRPGESVSAWRRRKRSPRAFDEAAIPVLAETWETGDWYQRENLLIYLVMRRPAEGLDIAWKALELNDGVPENHRGTAVVALSSYFGPNRQRPSEADVQRIVEVVRSEADRPSTRGIALQILQAWRFPRLDQLLLELEVDPSAETRLNAKIELLRRGHDIKTDDLFDELDLQPYREWELGRLWHERSRLDLTPDQASMLDHHILAEMTRHREACRHGDTYYTESAMILFSYIKNGLPAEEGDIDLIGGAVADMKRSRDQVEAVDAVAWFNNERSRVWLEKLTGADYLPAVRRRASHLLKRNKRSST